MKKLLRILVLIMLIITLFQIANMYALYKDQLQGEYTNLLGVWAIKVNEVDISSGEENLTFNMTEDHLTYVDSDHVKSLFGCHARHARLDLRFHLIYSGIDLFHRHRPRVLQSLQFLPQVRDRGIQPGMLPANRLDHLVHRLPPLPISQLRLADLVVLVFRFHSASSFILL